MYKRCFVLFIVLGMLLCGCDTNLLDGEYHSVTPHMLSSPQKEDAPIVCNTFEAIRDALIEMVEGGTAKGVIYMEGFSEKEMKLHMDNSINYIVKRNAIGAYAVERIQYELGTNAATPAVAVEITYLHDRSEILRMKRVSTMHGAIELINSALDNCSEGVTVLVERYTSIDLAQLVQDYVDSNPHICMENPQVHIVTYPEVGTKRILQLSFTYQTSRETLRMMQDTVKPVFSSAELYVQGDAIDAEKYAQLFSFLMERYEYTVETSITPTYSLLRHGVGDSKAFASVYMQMCEQAGLECQVVSGTKAGNAWNWNKIIIDNVYYYIDLLECKLAGVFVPVLAENMTGYVWDYSDINAENG